MRNRMHRSASRQAADVNLNLRVRALGTMLVSLFHYVQDTPDWQSWSSRSISLRKALELEKEQKAERILRNTGESVQIVGWKMREPLRAERTSPATLKMTHSRVMSGEYHGGRNGERPTAFDCDNIIKVLLWPEIGDTKAVAVRPRQTDQERRFAADLMGRNGALAQELAERTLSRGGMAAAA